MSKPSPISASWSTYFTYGLYDYSERTFWEGIQSLPAGHAMTWQGGALRVRCWYDLAERVGAECDTRPAEVVQEEYLSLLQQSVRLRFRSDVPVGINLSGGLDSSILLGSVQSVQGPNSDVKAFTFITGDSRYDELPWVKQMLARTCHPSVVCLLDPESMCRHLRVPCSGIRMSLLAACRHWRMPACSNRRARKA